MSSVENVSSYILGGYSISSKGNSLSEETLRKLEALGIDVASVKSETEAKKLIQQAEEEQEQQNSTGDTSKQETLFEKVKSLARKVGLNVSENEDFENVFSKISSKIEDLKGDGYGSGYNILQSEYEMLELQYNSEIKGGSSLLSALDILGQSNRMGIGL